MLPVQVRGGQLWGTDVYTVDSDLVAGMLSDIYFSFLSFLFLFFTGVQLPYVV